MPLDINEFNQDLFQDIMASADADGRYAEDSFFERFSEHLIEAGELETADRVQYLKPGLRVDGYGGDPRGAEGVLSLIVSDFQTSTEVTTLTATEMDEIFRRLSNFLSHSLDAEFRNRLEETSAAFGLADLIAQRWSDVAKVRLFLISNRLLSSRVDGRGGDDRSG